MIVSRRLGGWKPTLVLVLGAACAQATNEDDPHVEESDAAETDVEDTEPPVVEPAGRRPLCVEDDAMLPLPLAPALAAWAEVVSASENPYYGFGQVRALDTLGEIPPGEGEELATVLVLRGYHRLRTGDLDGAQADLDRALALVEASGGPLRRLARLHLAAVWLRRSELDNCVSSGDAGVCLVPFSEAAQHVLTEGMTQAAAIYTALLEEDDAEAAGPRWLLNVAHMALGDFPDGVPELWRLPAGALESEGEAEPWPNVARAIGLTEPGYAGGAALDDFDGDGRLDVMVSQMGPAAGMKLFLNEGTGRLCRASDASGLSAISGVLHFTTADYDNDGDLDVFAPRAGWMRDVGQLVAPSLLRNDGEGRFVDVAVEAGLAAPSTWAASQVGAWADIDGDGDLDLFVGRELREGADVTEPARSSLYVNQGDGTFVDVLPPGVSVFSKYVKGAAFGDVDNDGDPDLYVSVREGNNGLLINDGTGNFASSTRTRDVQAPHDSFSTWFFDHDQDGWEDLFVAAYPSIDGSVGPLGAGQGESAGGYARQVLGEPAGVETAKLFRNRGAAGGFEDVSAAVGLDDAHMVMGANFGDFDADGFPDLYLGTGAPPLDAIEPNAAYRNEGGTRFVDVTTAMHVGHLQKGHGVSFGDLDEDGDVDLLAEMGGAFPVDAFPSALFLNPTVAPHGVHLRLRGVEANRMALGARVRVVTEDRVIHHTVGATSSFGNNSHQVEVGLIEGENIVSIEIVWPGNPAPEIVSDSPADHIVWITQGEGIVHQQAWAPMVIHTEDGSGGHP